MTTPTPEQVRGLLERLLVGIDETEVESAYGWWETSTGAAFGSEKKAALMSALTALVDALEESERDAKRSADVIAELRRHLKAGATIKATDVGGAILEWKDYNTMYGGVTIDFPGGSMTWTGQGYNSIQVEIIAIDAAQQEGET